MELSQEDQASIQLLRKRHDTIIAQAGGNEKANLEIGCSTEDFEELGVLGKGAHGVVTKVRSRRDGNIYCLKKISLVSYKGKERTESLREVYMLRKLSHPHLIGYHNSFIEGESLHILMEFADCGDLQRVSFLTLANEKTHGHQQANYRV